MGPGEQRAGHPKTWPGAPLCAPRESLGVVGGRKRGGLQLSLGSEGSELKPGSLLQGSGLHPPEEEDMEQVSLGNTGHSPAPTCLSTAPCPSTGVAERTV